MHAKVFQRRRKNLKHPMALVHCAVDVSGILWWFLPHCRPWVYESVLLQIRFNRARLNCVRSNLIDRILLSQLFIDGFVLSDHRTNQRCIALWYYTFGRFWQELFKAARHSRTYTYTHIYVQLYTYSIRSFKYNCLIWNSLLNVNISCARYLC